MSFPSTRKLFLTVKPEKLFLLIALSFGVPFLVINPPLAAHDEASHFYRAYKISEGELLAQKTSSGRVGGIVPAHIVIAVKSATYDIPYSRESQIRLLLKQPGGFAELYPLTEEKKKRRKEVILSLLRQPARSSVDDIKPFAFFWGSASTSPVPYIPQAVGISLGRALVLSPVLLMYIGRLANLLCWVLLVYWAIRRTPVLKWGFLVLALTPSVLYASSSLSPDAFTIGTAFLLTAVLLSHAYSGQEALKGKDMFLIFFLSVAIGLSKSYFFLALLCLVLPARLFSSKKTRLLFLLLVATGVGASFAGWTYLVKDFAPPLAADQTAVMLSDPLSYVRVILNTLTTYARTYARSFFGHLGMHEVFIPSSLMLAHAIMLLLVSLADRPGSISIRLKHKVLFLGIFLLSAGFIFTALYLYWTPAGNPLVLGVQGRYFLPTAPLLLLLLANRKIALPGGTVWLNAAVFVYTLLCLSVSVHVLVTGYYA
jgi:uncharacterized membrane protein